MTHLRKVVLYIAASLDGFIAKANDDLSFLSMVQQEGEDYGYSGFLKTIDTVIMGRKTYDWVIAHIKEFPHSNLETYIITRTERDGGGNLNFYSGDLKDLVNRLKKEPGMNIFVDGGAEIVQELMKVRLIDEFYISIIPVLLGDGIRLFREGLPQLKLKLIDSKQFNTGLAQLHYILAEKK